MTLPPQNVCIMRVRPYWSRRLWATQPAGALPPHPPGFSALMPLPIGSYCEQIAKGGCRNIPPGSVEAHRVGAWVASQHGPILRSVQD
jgi:hypothetical protein